MELAQAIKDVGAGKSLLDIRAAAALMARLRGAAEHNDPLSGLTDRERTLLGLLSEGLTNRRIAARIPLRTATTAIHAIGGLVKVEAAVIRGSPEIALIAESRYAAMVCVGSMGIGRLPHVLLGSTATGPAHKAHCPVAIIRTDHDAPASDAGWVAVVVDDSPGNDAVLEHGFWNGPLPCTPDTPMELLPSMSARPTGMRIAVRTIGSRIRGLSRVRAQINLYSAWVISSTKRVKNG